MTAEEYSRNFLEREIITVSKLQNIYPFLSVSEKAILRKYTDDGFENLNEILRESKGLKINDFGSYLLDILSKFPNFEGSGFRGVNLSKGQILQYVEAFENETLITEHTFLSTSRKSNMARQFGKVFFEIYSENWKNIEEISLHPDEKELLLEPNLSFEVLSYTNENGFYQFKMIEI